MKDLLEIFWVFAKTGAITFGGGYAMLPIIQKEIVDDRRWLTEEQLVDFHSLSNCLPGIITLNTATFIGNYRKGKAGGIAACLGAITPSIIIIMLIAALITGFADIPAVKDAFAGIRACVCALVLNIVLKLWKKSVVGKTALVVFVCALAVSVFTSFSAALIIITAGVIGLVSFAVGSVSAKQGKGGGKE